MSTCAPPNIEGKPRYHGFQSGIPKYRNLTYLEEDVFYEVQRSYLTMVAYTDWLFGRLLSGITDSGLGDRTAIFASSDHGDFGGDYHLVSFVFCLFNVQDFQN